MSRSVNATLLAGMVSGAGDIIIRVKTWTDLADYNSNPTTPDNTWECLDFEIFSTSANAKLVTANDYTLSAFTIFIIERGLKISGTEYVVQSGIFFVEKYRESYGVIDISGSSYPNIKIYIAAGDGTYQAVIEAFCTAIGKTARFLQSTDPWLAYQFLETGKFVRNNKAERFENLIKQKYTILCYEESPKSLVFYTQDSYTQDNTWSSVCWSPALSLFVAVANTGTSNRAMTSPDGYDWTVRATPANVSPYTNEWSSVCWSPALSLFVAVGLTHTTENIMTSPDGINWTIRTSPTIKALTAVCWSPTLSLFVAVAYSNSTNSVVTSPDGINWTLRTSPTTNAWTSVCWSPTLSLFVAVGLTGSLNRAITSPDGINWTARVTTDRQWEAVAWSPALNLFVATGVPLATTDCVMTSPDGINWTMRVGGGFGSWRGLAWSPSLSLFVALSDGTGSYLNVMTSPDGISWTARSATTSKNWTALCWSPELSLFAGVGFSGPGNRVITSTDGITWSRISRLLNYNLAISNIVTLTYEDGPKSYLDRSDNEMHFIWDDELLVDHTSGDISTPQWHLGFLASTNDPPVTNQDTYYKIFLQKAPVRLDITDGDRIHFTPFWSIDPTKTIDAMMQVSEHFHTSEEPSWYQNIKSIVMFDKGEAG